MDKNITGTGYYFVKLNEVTFMDSEKCVFTADDFSSYSLIENAYLGYEDAKKDAEKFFGKVVEVVLMER